MLQRCLMTDSLSSLPFAEMLERAAGFGFTQLELATGNWSRAPHLSLDLLLDSSDAREQFLGQIDEHKLSIVALNCSGNQLAPNEEGARHAEVVEKTMVLAQLLEVETIIMMSGLPGGGGGERRANWITTSWPPENLEILSWQWKERLIPYWKDLVKRALDFGVKRIALENHGCQLVYNASTLHALREEVGPMIGANLDPSHLFWMGGDPRFMARSLGEAIYHVHAKDVRFESGLWQVDGMLDTQSIDRYGSRSWNYVALGWGHDAAWWKEFFSILVMVGYDGPVSLEMEDMTMDQVTGVAKSVELLDAVLQRV